MPTGGFTTTCTSGLRYDQPAHTHTLVTSSRAHSHTHTHAHTHTHTLSVCICTFLHSRLQDALVAAYPRVLNDERNTYVRYELDYFL